LLFVENVRDYFSVITLSAAEQFEAAAEAARRSLAGGKVYDLLTLRCAANARTKRVYARNVPEFTCWHPQNLERGRKGFPKG
jgi:predicted nucleic acid-binding protein